MTVSLRDACLEELVSWKLAKYRCLLHGKLSGQPRKSRREVDFPDLGGIRRRSRQNQRH